LVHPRNVTRRYPPMFHEPNVSGHTGCDASVLYRFRRGPAVKPCCGAKQAPGMFQSGVNFVHGRSSMG